MTQLPDHPVWCDPAHCDASRGHADVRHLSGPMTWRASNDDVQFALHRYQVDGGAPHWLLALCHLAVESPEGSRVEIEVELDDSDFDRLITARYDLRARSPRGDASRV